MLQQPRKWPGVLVAVVAGILVYRNPAGTAHLASGIHHAITTFAASLHL